jgi:ankyrin repeat protein
MCTARVHARCDQTPLHAASRRGHVNVAKVLLDYGADVNAQDSYDQTPLFLASCHEHIEFMRFVLKHGANVNVQTNYTYRTPLHLSLGMLEVALLLDHGADVHIRDKGGLTPFQWATERGHHDIAQLLLDRGAKENRSVLKI